jgi:hypothetical protein
MVLISKIGDVSTIIDACCHCAMVQLCRGWLSRKTPIAS